MRYSMESYAQEIVFWRSKSLSSKNVIIRATLDALFDCVHTNTKRLWPFFSNEVAYARRNSFLLNYQSRVSARVHARNRVQDFADVAALWMECILLRVSDKWWHRTHKWFASASTLDVYKSIHEPIETLNRQKNGNNSARRKQKISMKLNKIIRTMTPSHDTSSATLLSLTLGLGISVGFFLQNIHLVIPFISFYFRILRAAERTMGDRKWCAKLWIITGVNDTERTTNENAKQHSIVFFTCIKHRESIEPVYSTPKMKRKARKGSQVISFLLWI